MERHTVSGYELLFAEATGEDLDRLLRETATDPRAGVQAARLRALRRRERERTELLRLDALMELQSRLHGEGYLVVAGVDEVGLGALAGPVTAAAVVLDVGSRVSGLDDSKRLERHIRERVAGEVAGSCVSYAVAHVAAHVIDSIGIASATRSAMEIALAHLDARPSHVVVDGRPMGLPYPETAVVRGDSTVAAVAAASVIAKVARDEIMEGLNDHYPQWGFSANRGYGTSEHLDAIARHGVCPVHRRSFAPCLDAPTLF